MADDLEKEFSKELGILDSEEKIVEALEKVIMQRQELERKLEEELKVTHVPDDVRRAHEQKELFLEKKEKELREHLARVGTVDATESKRIAKDIRSGK
jgi:glutamate racemase